MNVHICSRRCNFCLNLHGAFLHFVKDMFFAQRQIMCCICHRGMDSGNCKNRKQTKKQEGKEKVGEKVEENIRLSSAEAPRTQ